jgi:hypothetical protein
VSGMVLAMLMILLAQWEFSLLPIQRAPLLSDRPSRNIEACQAHYGRLPMSDQGPRCNNLLRSGEMRITDENGVVTADSEEQVEVEPAPFPYRQAC